jgi:hypothetical protein
MLNENTNNIDVTPLGAFDGEEDDALEGDGEDSDEMEEIEEGVCNSSQPTQRKRTMNYAKVEDACFVKA